MDKLSLGKPKPKEFPKFQELLDRFLPVPTDELPSHWANRNTLARPASVIGTGMPTKTRPVSTTMDRPRLLALLFCDWANTTTEGKLNLIGVFDAISLIAGETRTPPFTVFARIANAADETLRLRVLGPDKVKVLEGIISSPDFPPPPDFSIQLITRIQFEPKIAGLYWFEVLYGKRSLGGAAMGLTLAPSERQGTDVTDS